MRMLMSNYGLAADPGISFSRTQSPSPPHSAGYQRLDPSSANNAPQAPISYASDLSSLTPSQSASQRASTSVERGQDERTTHDHQTESSPTPPKAAEEEIFYQGHVVVSIPPAHAISDLDLPTGVPIPKPASPTPASTSAVSASQSSTSNSHVTGTGLRYTRSRQRRPISRHISEASDEDVQEDRSAGVPPNVPLPVSGPSRTGSDANIPNPVVMRRSNSSDEFPHGPLEVVENDPFASVRSKSGSLRPLPATGDDRDQTPSPELRRGKLRERKTSVTFLSSLRGLFSHRTRTKGAGGPAAVWEGPLTAEPTSFKSTGGWSTRIDGHLRNGRNSTDSEAGPKPGIRQSLSGVSPKSKLRKVRGQPMVKSSSSPGSPRVHAGNANGWVTDGESARGMVKGRSKRRKKSIAALKGSDGGFTDGEVDNDTDQGVHRSRPHSVQTERPYVPPAALSGSSLDANVRTPRPGRLSAGPLGSSSSLTESPSSPSSQKVSAQVQAHPSSLTPGASPPGRRGAKSGTLHTPNGSADQSLMSIVEDVTRQNRERNIASALATLNGRASSSNGNLPVLEVPRAPPPQAPHTPSTTTPRGPAREGLGQQPPNGKARSLDLQRRGSVSSTSRVNAASTSPKMRSTPSSEVKSVPPAGSVVSGSSGTNPSTSSQLAKTPLRSALRNASRTPSPNPVTFTTPAIPFQGQPAYVTEADQVGRRSLEQILSATRGSSVPDLRDSMSISSYETGRESPIGSPSSPSPAPLPPLSPAPQPHLSLQAPPLLHDQDSRDQGGASSTVSTETPTAVRRKSVRMSLHPTFSPPLPPSAVYDQFDGDEAEATWSDRPRPVEGWKTRAALHAAAAASPIDVWQDSSEEDEEYSRARRLLSRVAKGKGKGKV
ncbi:hypothetical protein M404DRAFT_817836 [Pisolithus tinctorius Marx 270]|uniref:Uncharacterized protein n=1 Tax=Pisolithus tinctorius Marx 270 TaxID=870435 RepID=A0A0C3NVB9_PISTI|nr:hypothetical protein M404DRAFT_817836 [Pisolithus tinctorius Marx 270]